MASTSPVLETDAIATFVDCQTASVVTGRVEPSDEISVARKLHGFANDRRR